MKIQNIQKLLRLYFIENWKKDLLWVFGLTCLITFLIVQTNPGPYHSLIELLVAAVFLLSFPDRLFNNLGNPSQRIHYLMIPASTTEKVVTNILLANVYAVLGVAISVFVGYSLSYLVLELRNIPTLPDYMARYAELADWGTCGWISFETAISVFFFGSIYFRKKGFYKTAGIVSAVGMAFLSLFVLVLWLNLASTADLDFTNYSWEISMFYDVPSRLVELLYIIANIIFIIFFFGLSFLRMKETEA